MFCSIYVIHNSEATKVYIGQTWKPIHKRLQEHKLQRNDTKRRSTKLARAMNKYGIDKFSVELLTIVNSQEIADYWENFFIEKFNSIVNGYNLKNGGSNGKHSTETILKISNIKKGRKFSEEHKQNLSKAKIGKPNLHLVGNKFWLGKTHSEKTKKILSDLGSGRALSETTKRKISKSSKGKSKPTIRKFNSETEILIKSEYEISGITLDDLSKKYNCSISTIHRIVKGRNNV